MFKIIKVTYTYVPTNTILLNISFFFCKRIYSSVPGHHVNIHNKLRMTLCQKIAFLCYDMSAQHTHTCYYTMRIQVHESAYEETEKYICIFLHFSNLRLHRYLESFRVDKDPSILHNRRYFCWWHGSTRNQVISIHDIDLVIQEKFSFSCRRLSIRHLCCSLWF